MIKSIHLKNWRSHSETKLEFAKGTNALLGIMGSGKSSVLDALCFAFYGTFPRLQRRDTSLADVVREGEKGAEVSVLFDAGGSEYSVMRRISDGAAEAEARKDGRLMEKGPKAVTRFVQDALKVDYDLFTRAIYSEQNKIDYILNLGPKERKSEIDGLLGLDKFEEVRQNATSVANKLRERRQMLEEQATPEKLESVQKARQEAEAALSKMRKELEAVKEARLKAAKDEAAALSAWNGHSKLKERHDALRTGLERKKAIAEKLRNELSAKKPRTAEEVSVLEKSAAELEAQISKRKAERSSLISNANSFSSQMGAIEAEMRSRKEAVLRAEALKKEIDAALAGKTPENARTGLDALEEKLEGRRAEVLSLKSRIADMEKALAELKRDLAHCPVCETELTPQKKAELRAKREKEISDARNSEKTSLLEASSLEKEFKAKSDALRRAEVGLKSLLGISVKPEEEKELASRLTAVKDSFSKSQGAKEGIDKEIDALQKSSEDKRVALREEQELARKSAEATENEKLAAEAENELASLKFSAEEYESSRKALETARVSLGVAAEKESSLLREARLHEQAVAQASSEEKNILGIVEMAKSYASEEQRMVVFKNSVAEAQAQIRAELVEAINAALLEIWPTLYPYGNYSSIRIMPDAKDYSLEVQPLSGEWRNMESVASGGERACVSLALRIAFAMVLTPNLSWLILDEPTHNLDAAAVSALGETLQERIPKIVEQTFVITHDQSLMEAEFASIYKFSRNKEKNGPTAVERM